MDHTNNTVSNISTRFLRGVDIIEDFNKEWEIPSENWSYPVISYGDHRDPYYAEIWENGMDYNICFYLLEQIKFEIKIHLLIVVDNNEWRKLEEKSEDQDFLTAILYLRRNKVWIKHDEHSVYHDTFIPYLNYYDGDTAPYELYTGKKWSRTLSNCYFEHSSQPRCYMMIDKDLFYNLRKEKLNKIKNLDIKRDNRI